jgi:multiple sugar transport system substrate-binding protein
MSATHHPTTRRGFLKVAAAGTAAALSRAVPAAAAEKTITILHESSFIKPFDEYVVNTLAPAYEKETGIKINYEVTSVGSLPTRISTIAETGSGADITMNGLLQVIQFADRYLDVGDMAEEIGKAQGVGTTPAGRLCWWMANGRRFHSATSDN